VTSLAAYLLCFICSVTSVFCVFLSTTREGPALWVVTALALVAAWQSGCYFAIGFVERLREKYEE